MQFSYFSKSEGTGGGIKQIPEDFIVEEIMQNGTILELNKKIQIPDESGKFTYFVMQKKDWSTSNAIKIISKKLNTGQRRFNYAGTKDKKAITTQLCSAFDIPKESVQNLSLKDIQINGCWTQKEKIKLGQLLGNRFTIKLRNAKSNANGLISETYNELEGKFPNYFGEQRFGTTRKNTHKIGELILKGRFKQAVLDYLCDYEGEENQETVLARKELKSTLDFKSALKIFPKYLIHERTLLDFLSKNPTNFIGALRKLPRPILLLFVHAFQSYLFNLNLSQRIQEEEIKKEQGEYFCNSNSLGFPDLEEKGEQWLAVKVIGYESKLNQREKSLLEQFMVHQDDFKLKSIPEISSKGTFRTFFSSLKDFNFSEDVFTFSLSSGCYATSALREFTKNK